MNTLLKVIKRLAFSQLHTSNKQQIKYILSHVKRALYFSFGTYEKLFFHYFKLSKKNDGLIIKLINSFKYLINLNVYFQEYPKT